MSTIAFELENHEEARSFVAKTEERMDVLPIASYSRFLLKDHSIVAVFRMKLVPRWIMRILCKRGLRKHGYKKVILKYSTEDILQYLVIRCHKQKFMPG